MNPSMNSTVFDSGLFRDMFATEAMRETFSDVNYVRCCLDAEAALARAQAAIGMIPQAAARNITEAAASMQPDMARLKADCENVGYPIVGLVRQLADACNSESAGYVHWGATTQDIMDTAVVLQVRRGLELVEADLVACIDSLAALARAHRDVPMAGRTHLQHALPITFGFKAASWRDPLVRHLERLRQMRPRVLVGQLGGAAGTLASLGPDGLKVRAAMMRELGLGERHITWHVSRDGLAEAVMLLGMVTGSLAKVGTDMMIMMANEFGEAFEPFQHGRGSSSTMPQKRNPISSELMVAGAKIVRQQCALMLDAMVQDFERATGPWHAEWAAIPESFLASSGALAQARVMFAGMTVDAARMRSNLDISKGLIMAEAVMMGLAPALGRNQAHHVVYDACLEAQRGASLLDVLCANPAVASHLTRDQIAALLEPSNYLGTAAQMVDLSLSDNQKETS
jgi:3-carboxy-cis,cis-muconate cycloisomerase